LFQNGAGFLGELSLGVAFVAGLLSFLAPCVLPLVPVYISILTGPEVFEKDKQRRSYIFLHALSFVMGFVIVFTLVGAGFGLFGLALSEHATLIRYISGGLLVFFGLFMLISKWLPLLNFEKRLKPNTGRATGYARSLLVGAVFTFAWTPCVGPILASILTLAVESKTAAAGAALLLVYALGLGLPFLILGAAFETINPWLRRIGKYSVIIQVVSGVLLVAVGILTLLNRLTWLQ
jgi:cytochrome c-type biogenesis protein